jgi:hypothetical protein
MKKILVLLLVINYVYASKYMSSIKLPKNIIINLDTKECNQECLVNNFNSGNIFNFLGNYKLENSSPEILSFYSKYKKQLNVSTNEYSLKLAVLIPKVVIGRYSQSTIQAILTYLISRDSDFEVKVFNCKTEDLESIKEQVSLIEEEGYKTVFSVFTKNGFENLKKIDTNLKFLIPTVNDDNLGANEKYILGGIDYKAQINRLFNYSSDKISIFYDDSVISTKLTNDIMSLSKNMNKRIYKNEISPKETKFNRVLRKSGVQNSTLFLNLPIVKSSLLLSSITHYNKAIKKVISTQINYNPLILELTQVKDRRNMLIANSIIKKNNLLEEYNSLFGVDITYDWINYTSTVVVDYIFSKENNIDRIYDIELKNGSFIYDVEVREIEKYKL